MENKSNDKQYKNQAASRAQHSRANKFMHPLHQNEIHSQFKNNENDAESWFIVFFLSWRIWYSIYLHLFTYLHIRHTKLHSSWVVNLNNSIYITLNTTIAFGSGKEFYVMILWNFAIKFANERRGWKKNRARKSKNDRLRAVV